MRLRKMTEKIGKFKASTIGLMVSHENLKKNKLVRVDFHAVGDDMVALLAVSANNLCRIKTIPTVVINRTEYADRPFDDYNSSTEAVWALEKCGCDV